MTISALELAAYAGALLILFLTPGPVWVALVARALSGGFHAAWPLALGVVVGDMLWPFLAILGVAWILTVFSGFLVALKWVAAATFLVMGVLIWRNADVELSKDSRLTRPGMLAGFAAGLAVIIGNPKAILFYMGMLPGFFDITRVTWMDMVVISLISAIVPLAGNLVLALSIDRVKRLLSSPQAVRRTNRTAGGLLIAVGLVIPFT
ncbi:LysE family translocator [Anianabacter salinae]|uniref:LysE family translocator n=1 Tax=Anianabacter salinae TaxID=2851023 RepID=UPI00225DEF3D|nr:LysE family translocator [Anianabacter salinae]MBV0913428.1 LysE family translocator [Anianabacter salinae]